MEGHFIEVEIKKSREGYRDEVFYSTDRHFVISKTCDFAKGSTYLARVREYEGAIVLANYYAEKHGAKVRDLAGPELLGYKEVRKKGKK